MVGSQRAVGSEFRGDNAGAMDGQHAGRSKRKSEIVQREQSNTAARCLDVQSLHLACWIGAC